MALAGSRASCKMLFGLIKDSSYKAVKYSKAAEHGSLDGKTLEEKEN